MWCSTSSKGSVLPADMSMQPHDTACNEVLPIFLVVTDISACVQHGGVRVGELWAAPLQIQRGGHDPGGG